MSTQINWKDFADRHDLSYGLVRVVNHRYRYKNNRLPYGEDTIKVLLAMSKEFEEPVLPIIKTLRILEANDAI